MSEADAPSIVRFIPTPSHAEMIGVKLFISQVITCKSKDEVLRLEEIYRSSGVGKTIDFAYAAMDEQERDRILQLRTQSPI